MSNEKNDVEASSSLLYPLMQESPELRWAFIRKVYCILTVQLLVTIAFAALVVAVRPVATFFTTTRIGLAVYVVIVLIPTIVICPLYFCKHKHPLNFVLLGIFTLCYGLALGVVCAFISGKVVMESAGDNGCGYQSHIIHILGSKERPRFRISYSLSIFFPMGKISEMIYSGLIVIVFCAYIINDTDNLIKRNSYDEYIWASVALYLDVLNLFLHLLEIFRASDR
ncbi:protein LIFEGUARD 2 [Sesamum alatum]|uniref:Protein LIFEGUARD 2 n=1 Tax=Sesamum alatum TaxID=300844 RepID=A0AAE2CDM8_9LAMI|nr:protein LIFEGUARD 2 [Sesamum alatum]